jgi:hypothetical protein
VWYRLSKLRCLRRRSRRIDVDPTAVAVANLIADIIYAFLDPRVRYA